MLVLELELELEQFLPELGVAALALLRARPQHVLQRKFQALQRRWVQM